jgi:C4-dicarboxylate-specific signal transduction histidine kinase
MNRLRLNIGPRLVLCFALIIVSMLAGDLAILWQFHIVQSQAERLNAYDEELASVLRVHSDMLKSRDELESLAAAKNADRMNAGAQRMNEAFAEDTRRAQGALLAVHSDDAFGSTILPTLTVVQSTLQSLTGSMIGLAEADDWNAAQSRLANEIRPLELSTATLVERVDREVKEEQARGALRIKRVQQRVFLLLPISALSTLLVAGILGTAITRSITRPLEILVEGSQRMAQGDFEHPVAIRGNDELARLGKVFNQTARQLKELYESLQSSEAFLAHGQRISHTGTFGWSIAKGEFYWSEENYNILEYDRSAEASLELALQRMHPDDRDRVRQFLDNAIREKRDFDSEHRLLMPDGRVKHVHTTGRAINTGNLDFVGAVRDVTERMRADDALRQAQGDLARINRVTTMGELSASLAHEVSQPISGAMTNASVCLRTLGSDKPDLDLARTAVARIVRDAKRAAEIIARIRLQFEKGSLNQETLGVSEMIRETVALLRGEAMRHNISVRTELGDDLPPIVGDRVQLQQVAMNLIVNSIEAMKDVDGIREMVIQSQRAENKQILVSVSDTGVGLPPQHMEQIFDPFFTTKPHGTGMGLRISRSIIESHGGRLWATQNHPNGASFHFTLAG